MILTDGYHYVVACAILRAIHHDPDVDDHDDEATTTTMTIIMMMKLVCTNCLTLCLTTKQNGFEMAVCFFTSFPFLDVVSS